VVGIEKIMIKGKNKSTNQQINKSTNQQINKSTNQQINKSTNQQINTSTIPGVFSGPDTSGNTSTVEKARCVKFPCFTII